MVMNLARPQNTRYILEKFGIRARKRYGQNFLVDESVVNAVIDGSGVTEDDTVLEIGPGIGTMTGYLARRAGRVVCIEVDETLSPVLAETLEGLENVEVIFEDVLKADLENVLAEDIAGGKRIHVVANLPYYVTTPIILHLLSYKGLFDSITLMVQKEVADRVIAGPGTKTYGALSLAVQYYADPVIIGDVPPASFIPRPGVDSAILHMEAYGEPPVDAPADALFCVIRASFNQRRKTLANGLTSGMAACGASRNPSRAEVEEALKDLGLDQNIRGEKLSLEEFSRITKHLEGCFF